PPRRSMPTERSISRAKPAKGSSSGRGGNTRSWPGTRWGNALSRRTPSVTGHCSFAASTTWRASRRNDRDSGRSDNNTRGPRRSSLHQRGLWLFINSQRKHGAGSDRRDQFRAASVLVVHFREREGLRVRIADRPHQFALFRTVVIAVVVVPQRQPG